MEYQDVLTFIQTVGFPIVMCLLMFKKMNDDRDAHKKEIDELKDSINDLNKTIQRFYESRVDKNG